MAFFATDTDVVTKYNAAVDEIEKLRAENAMLISAHEEALTRAIDIFSNGPCSKHSGENTPPFAEFIERIKGHCLLCEIDENARLHEENTRMHDACTAVAGDFAGHYLDQPNIVEKLRSALESMCYQFGVWHEGVGGIGTGGLSDLETAFSLLGWDDPHPVPSMCCDEPGCTKRATCGFPTPTGYRRTCGKHMQE